MSAFWHSPVTCKFSQQCYMAFYNQGYLNLSEPQKEQEYEFSCIEFS